MVQNDGEMPTEISGQQARGGSAITGRVLTILLVSMAFAVVFGAILLFAFQRGAFR